MPPQKVQPQNNQAAITKESIERAARYSNFAQWFKSTIWERMEGNQLPEKALDEIAQLIFDREENQLAAQDKASREDERARLHELIRPMQKDCLSQFAYQGADIPKTVVRDIKNQAEGYRECRDEILVLIHSQDEPNR